jgi:hypothetical protein
MNKWTIAIKENKRLHFATRTKGYSKDIDKAILFDTRESARIGRIGPNEKVFKVKLGSLKVDTTVRA